MSCSVHQQNFIFEKTNKLIVRNTVSQLIPNIEIQILSILHPFNKTKNI